MRVGPQRQEKKRQAINKNESVVCIFDEGPVTVLDGQSLTAQKKMHIFFKFSTSSVFPMMLDGLLLLRLHRSRGALT